MLWTPGVGSDFAWHAGSHVATRPSTAFGTTITPGLNAMGSYAQVLASGTVAKDVFGLLINVNSCAVNATARDAIMDVGVDPAGGSAYTVLIPNLMIAAASPYTVGGGIWYYFPIWIKAGSSVGVRGSVNAGTAGTFRCNMRVFGDPKNRSLVKVGTRVEAIGITTATSNGTSVTTGTTSDGSWTSLGTSAKDNWYWAVGFANNSSTMGTFAYHASLGVGSPQQLIMDPQHFTTTTGEQISNGIPSVESNKLVGAGSTVYGKLWCSGGGDAGTSLAAYGLGG